MKNLRTKFTLIVLLFGILVLGVTNAFAYVPKDCVVITTNNYYAREVHNDFMVREIEVCLSHNTKSIAYELPPLDVPLVLETTDGATLTVRLSPIEDLSQPFFMLEGESVEVFLPESVRHLRYQMQVSVANSSEGVIEGSVDGQVIGRILLRDIHSTGADSLMIALGGLSTEWWFEVASSPPRSVVVFALTTSLTQEGEFFLSEAGWIRIYPSEPLVVLGDDWLEGGYFAIKVTFPR